MEIIIIVLLFISNIFVFTALVIMYNKYRKLYFELMYVNSVLDLILRYTENKLKVKEKEL